jgi:hypothetical protein
MFLENRKDETRKVLTWIDETKRLTHELTGHLNLEDFPSQLTVTDILGKPVCEALTALHVAANEAINQLAKLMVENKTAVEMFSHDTHRITTYGELFEALGRRAETNGCTPDWLHVKAICSENHLEFYQLIANLEKHGAGCECTCLELAASGKIDLNQRIPSLPF